MTSYLELAKRAGTPHEQGATTRALAVTSQFTTAEMPSRCGDDCYSYYFVFRAFAPLLARLGTIYEVAGPEAELQATIIAACHKHRAVGHLAILPPQYISLARGVPNIAFPFWEYPDIPDYDVGGNPRYNWREVCRGLALILTACDFTRESFERAGVQAPVRVVPVPVHGSYFALPAWEPRQRVTIDCPCYLLPQAPTRPARVGATDRARRAYRQRVAPYLPARVRHRLSAAGRQVLGPPAPEDPFPIRYVTTDRLEMRGIVYTSVFNPFDLRKNWQDMLAGFLAALGDREDAMLVMKLAVSRTMLREGLFRLFSFYDRLQVRHRSKVAIVSDYLSDEQMLELARGSTYYVNTSHGEGACLPLQGFLAGGRPGLAPRHTALGEYVDEQVAFVLPTRTEPTFWSWDREQRLTTSWRPIERPGFEQQLRRSYEIVRRDRDGYQDIAAAARRRLTDFASAQRVWPRLAEAMSLVWPTVEAKPAA